MFIDYDKGIIFNLVVGLEVIIGFLRMKGGSVIKIFLEFILFKVYVFIF